MKGLKTARHRPQRAKADATTKRRPPSAAMFGASTAAPAASGGFSFGAGSSAAPAASSGFNFGSSAAPAASGGFNFGSNAAPAPATSSTGFGFGTTATSTAPAASTGFGFGASTTAAAPAAGTSSFSFGAPAAGATAAAPAASGGFNFGGTTAAPAATSSFGTGSSFSFGGAATGSASPKPSLFGQTTTPATGTASGSSLFGGFGTTAKPAGTGFGGFGTTTTTPSTGFGGFGTSTTTPSTGFGGFGTTATPAAGASAFGAAPAAAASTAPPPIILSAADASVAQLNTVKYAYQDPAQSRFKFLMYNQVDPTQRHLYVRPPHVSERLWTQAELDNPDPNNCVPVAIVGFPDLLKRIQAQQTHADKLNTFTDDLRSQLQEMEKHTRATEEKLEKCRHEHVQLFHALVKVMKDIEFLQNLGKPLQRSEMDLVMALKKLQTLLDAPGQYKARLNDVVALQRVQQRPQVAPAAHQLTPDDLQRMYQFLDKQRQGLEHLTSILQDDLADIKLMKETWRR